MTISESGLYWGDEGDIYEFDGSDWYALGARYICDEQPVVGPKLVRPSATPPEPVQDGWLPIAEGKKNKVCQLWVANGFLFDHVKIGIIDPANHPAGVYSFFDDGESAGMLPEEWATYCRPLPPPPQKGE
jgi:hypothetical protein